MFIKEISIDRIFNLGNYENVKIGLKANLDENLNEKLETSAKILEEEIKKIRENMEE